MTFPKVPTTGTSIQKSHSDNPMDEHTRVLNELADKLGIARAKYYEAEARRKNHLSRIRDKMPGKSFAERQGQAEGTEEALAFLLEHGRLKAIYELYVDRFEIAKSEWFSWHQMHKQNHDMIKKE